MALDINKRRNDLCHSCLHVIHLLFQATAFSSSRKASWVTPPIVSSLPTLPSSFLLFFLSFTAYLSYMNKFHWKTNKNSMKKWDPVLPMETSIFILTSDSQTCSGLTYGKGTRKKRDGQCREIFLRVPLPQWPHCNGKGSCCEVKPWPMFKPLHLYRN